MAPTKQKKASKIKNKGVGVDFKRVKHKVGRKLPAAQNETRVEFKAKAIILSEQSIARDKIGVAVNQRNKTLKDLLNQTTHHNERVRKDALLGLKDFFAQNPSEIGRHTVLLVQKLSSRLTDVDKAVRHTLLILLRSSIFTNLPQRVMGSFLPVIMAHVATAMTHMSLDVRINAFLFLDLLIEYFPSFLTKSFSAQIFGHYIDYLGDRGHDIGSVSSVLSSLVQFLSISTAQDDEQKCSASSAEHKWLQKSEVQQQVKPLHFYRSEVPEAYGMGKGLNVLTGDNIELLKSLAKVLLNYWSELSPTVCSGASPDILGLECMVNITKALGFLCKWLGQIMEGSSRRSKDVHEFVNVTEPSNAMKQVTNEMFGYLLALFLRHLMVLFPVYMPSTNTTQKVKEGLAALNVGVCAVMLHFVKRESISVMKEKHRILLIKVLEFYENALSGMVLPSTGVSACIIDQKLAEPHVKIILQFLPSVVKHVPEEWYFRLLQVFTDIFRSCKAKSDIKLECIAIISSMLENESGLAEKDRNAVPEMFCKQWLQVLPKLLWELKNHQPSFTKMLLQVLLRLGQTAEVGSPLAVEYAHLQSTIIPFFCTFHKNVRRDNRIYGPFVALPEVCQQLAIDVLYYFLDISVALLKSVAWCCLCLDVDLHIVVRAVEILQAAYMRGSIGASEYISFFLTLMLERNAIPDDAMTKDVLKRHLVITTLSCSSLCRIGDGVIILNMVESSLQENLLEPSCRIILLKILRFLILLIKQGGGPVLPLTLLELLSSKVVGSLISTNLDKLLDGKCEDYILHHCIALSCTNKSFAESVVASLNSTLLDGAGTDRKRLNLLLKIMIKLLNHEKAPHAFSSSKLMILGIVSSLGCNKIVIGSGELLNMWELLNTLVQAHFGAVTK